MRRTLRSTTVCRVLAFALAASAGLTLAGCNDAQAGALLGGGVGALAGQAIGHDTKGTLIGTAVGVGAGYIIGNELDKDKERRRQYHDPKYDY